MTVARRFDSPLASRWLEADETDGWWCEIKHGDPEPYLDAEQLERVRSITAPVSDVAELQGEISRVRAAPPATRVIDELLAPRRSGRAELEPALRAAGRTLARLHRGAVPDALPMRGSEPPWFGAMPALAATVVQRAAELAATVREAAGTDGWEGCAGPRVMVHGHAGLGNITVLGPTLLGWREAGTGPAELDLGLVVAECAELAAGGVLEPDDAYCLAAAFIAGWHSESAAPGCTPDGVSERIIPAAAVRTGQHFALNEALVRRTTPTQINELAVAVGTALRAWRRREWAEREELLA